MIKQLLKVRNYLFRRQLRALLHDWQWNKVGRYSKTSLEKA